VILWDALNRVMTAVMYLKWLIKQLLTGLSDSLPDTRFNFLR
jgi:hypothetical protein